MMFLWLNPSETAMKCPKITGLKNTGKRFTVRYRKSPFLIGSHQLFLQCEAPKIAKFVYNSNNYLVTSKLILNDYPDYGLRVYGLLLVPKLNGFVCLPWGYIDVCFRVLLVIPKWSGTTLKALILGSPVPMNTFTEELQNEPILDPCLYFNS